MGCMCNRRTYIKSNIISPKDKKIENLISDNINETNSISNIKFNNYIEKKKKFRK